MDSTGPGLGSVVNSFEYDDDISNFIKSGEFIDFLLSATQKGLGSIDLVTK
jgi:hypothetical protein